MRRILFLGCLLPVLVLSAAAKGERPYAGLIIQSGPREEHTLAMLEGLYDRGIRGTFLLRGSEAEQMPQALARILEEGHEIGCRGYTGKNMVYMSRRAIAEELIRFQDLLPEGYPLRLFTPPGGCGDGVLQVARARRLGILSWAADLSAAPEAVRDGDLLLLCDLDPLAVEESLSMVDALTDLGFRLIPVSELAKLRQTKIRPGEIYSRFPASTDK